MATIVAIVSGNWSDTSGTSPWPSGTKPSSGDTVQCADYTVTIDESITVVKIELDGAHTGGFLVTDAPVSITAIVVQSSSHTAPCLTLSHATGTVTITGTPSSAGNGQAIYQDGAGDLAITGDINPAVIPEATTLFMDAGGNLTITGDVTGYGDGAIWATLTGAISVIGNLYNDGGMALYVVNASSLTVSGSIVGGTVTCTVNVSVAIPITADRISNPTGSDASAIWSDTLYGEVLPVAVRSIEAIAMWPFFGSFLLVLAMPAANPQIIVVDDASATRTLSDDYPAVADVKDGVAYKLGTLEGELVAGISNVVVNIGGNVYRRV